MQQTPENISEYFKYVTDKKQRFAGIGLTEKAGEFQGVVYKYGTIVPPKEIVKIIPGADKDNKVPFKFEWEILDSNGLPKERFNEKFFQLIGDVLVHIIFKERLYNDRKNDT
jgi:hypothetical protein